MKKGILDVFGNEIVGVLTPVSICMFLVVLLVHILIPHGDDAPVSSLTNMVYNEQASDSFSDKLGGGSLDALVFEVIVTLVTLMLLALSYYRCTKCLRVYMRFSVFTVLACMGGLVAVQIIKKYSIPIDLITLSICTINFASVGTAAVFLYRMPIMVTQGYLIVIGMLVAFWFTTLPEWTTWVLLLAIAAHVAVAVNLNLLVELAIERDEDITALIYEALPNVPASTMRMPPPQAHMPSLDAERPRRVRRRGRTRTSSSGTDLRESPRLSGNESLIPDDAQTLITDPPSEPQVRIIGFPMISSTGDAGTLHALSTIVNENQVLDDERAPLVQRPTQSSATPDCRVEAALIYEARPNVPASTMRMPPPQAQLASLDAERPRRMRRWRRTRTSSPGTDLRESPRLSGNDSLTPDDAQTLTTGPPSEPKVRIVGFRLMSSTGDAGTSHALSTIVNENQVLDDERAPLVQRPAQSSATPDCRVGAVLIYEARPNVPAITMRMLPPQAQMASLDVDRHRRVRRWRRKRISSPGTDRRESPRLSGNNSPTPDDAQTLISGPPTEPEVGIIGSRLISSTGDAGTLHALSTFVNENQVLDDETPLLQRPAQSSATPVCREDADRAMNRGSPASEEDDEHLGLGPFGAITLGLEDFVFYSVLVMRAAMYDLMTVYACYLAIGTTLILLAVWQRALPAQSISISLGVLFYFFARIFMDPFILDMSTNLVFL